MVTDTDYQLLKEESKKKGFGLLPEHEVRNLEANTPMCMRVWFRIRGY